MIFMNRGGGSAPCGGRYHGRVPPECLYPDAPLLRRHALPVGDGHTLEVQEFGDVRGLPALLLHGGPGSGSSPLLRRFFDARRFRLICVDQRGAGASTPRGALGHNTTPHLLADLRAVRAALGVARWLVVGGSWGATLAVAHAADAPQAVSGMLLRSSFLARAEDITWFFHGAAEVEPEAWRAFAAAAPPAEHDALLPWLARTLQHGTRAAQEQAAHAWWQWEQALAGTCAAAPEGDALAALVDRYRVQSNYLMHQCFFAATPLLQRCAQVPRVPTLLLHGRADRVCRPEGALALQRALPHAKLHWIDDAGHDPTHPAIAAAMVQALDHWAGHEDFAAAAVVPS